MTGAQPSLILVAIAEPVCCLSNRYASGIVQGKSPPPPRSHQCVIQIQQREGDADELAWCLIFIHSLGITCRGSGAGRNQDGATLPLVLLPLLPHCCIVARPPLLRSDNTVGEGGGGDGGETLIATATMVKQGLHETSPRRSGWCSPCIRQQVAVLAAGRAKRREGDV